MGKVLVFLYYLKNREPWHLFCLINFLTRNVSVRDCNPLKANSNKTSGLKKEEGKFQGSRPALALIRL
jgi:hypothetical protein